jgi:hypothetical protein
MHTTMTLSLLDTFLPSFDQHNKHVIVIDASPAQVHTALQTITTDELPISRLLMAIRALPGRLTARGRASGTLHRPVLHLLTSRNFAPLANEPGVEMVVGLISQPWKLRGGATHRIVDARDFVAFSQPGFTKVAMNFSFHPVDGSTRVATETRILATDPDTRTRFQRYWRVVRIGSGIIRWDLLRAIKRRAERAPGA